MILITILLVKAHYILLRGTHTKKWFLSFIIESSISSAYDRFAPLWIVWCLDNWQTRCACSAWTRKPRLCKGFYGLDIEYPLLGMVRISHYRNGQKTLLAWKKCWKLAWESALITRTLEKLDKSRKNAWYSNLFVHPIKGYYECIFSPSLSSCSCNQRKTNFPRQEFSIDFQIVENHYSCRLSRGIFFHTACQLR